MTRLRLRPGEAAYAEIPSAWVARAKRQAAERAARLHAALLDVPVPEVVWVVAEVGDVVPPPLQQWVRQRFHRRPIIGPGPGHGKVYAFMDADRPGCVFVLARCCLADIPMVVAHEMNHLHQLARYGALEFAESRHSATQRRQLEMEADALVYGLCAHSLN